MKNIHHSQAGGITILVSLMLLVLLTIAAVGMSRNSFREVVSSGTSRQGAMTRNLADSGVEWSYFWITNSNVAASGTPLKLKTLKTELLLDDTLAGKMWDPQSIPTSPTSTEYKPNGTLQTDCELPIPAGSTVSQQGFTIGLTAMGKLPIADTSQGVTGGAFRPASGEVNKQAPNLWAVRSDAQVVTGPVTFTHAKEAWISEPVTNN